jgi:hypothetical protein
MKVSLEITTVQKFYITEFNRNYLQIKFEIIHKQEL